jgi:hypothetical protein
MAKPNALREPRHAPRIKSLGRKTLAITSAAICLTTAVVSNPAQAAPNRPDRNPDLDLVRLPDLPAGTALNAIANGPGEQAWAVGKAPDPTDPTRCTAIILHWDGHRWSQEKLPALDPINDEAVTDAALTAITVGRDGQVFAAGVQRATGHYQALAVHREARGWVELPTPAQVKVATTSIFGILATDAKHVWIYGQQSFHKIHSYLNFWDGTQWADFASPPISGRQDYLVGLTGNINDLWVLGKVGKSTEPRSRGLAAHWDGTAWTASELPADVMYTPLGMAAAERDQLWIWGSDINDAPVIERCDGPVWTAGPPLPDSATGLTIDQIEPVDRQRVILAGTQPVSGAADGQRNATLLTWRGSRWSELVLPEKLAQSHVWQVGTAAGDHHGETWVFANTASSPTTTDQGTVVMLRSKPSAGLRN